MECLDVTQWLRAQRRCGVAPLGRVGAESCGGFNWNAFLSCTTPCAALLPVASADSLGTPCGAPSAPWTQDQDERLRRDLPAEIVRCPGATPFSLVDLWMAFEDVSLFGVDVPVVDSAGFCTHVTYVPYLSALRIVGEVQALQTFDTEPPRSARSQPAMSQSSRSQSAASQRGLRGRLPQTPRSAFGDSNCGTKDCDPMAASTMSIEFFETKPPHMRVPLFTQLRALWEGRALHLTCEQISLLMADDTTMVDPKSWIAVYWKPVQQPIRSSGPAKNESSRGRRHSSSYPSVLVYYALSRLVPSTWRSKYPQLPRYRGSPRRGLLEHIAALTPSRQPTNSTRVSTETSGSQPRVSDDAVQQRPSFGRRESIGAADANESSSPSEDHSAARMSQEEDCCTDNSAELSACERQRCLSDQRVSEEDYRQPKNDSHLLSFEQKEEADCSEDGSDDEDENDVVVDGQINCWPQVHNNPVYHHPTRSLGTDDSCSQTAVNNGQILTASASFADSWHSIGGSCAPAATRVTLKELTGSRCVHCADKTSQRMRVILEQERRRIFVGGHDSLLPPTTTDVYRTAEALSITKVQPFAVMPQSVDFESWTVDSTSDVDSSVHHFLAVRQTLQCWLDDQGLKHPDFDFLAPRLPTPSAS